MLSKNKHSLTIYFDPGMPNIEYGDLCCNNDDLEKNKWYKE